MSCLEPSASQQEEDISVWELPADGQHLHEDRIMTPSAKSFTEPVINTSLMKEKKKKKKKKSSAKHLNILRLLKLELIRNHLCDF